MGQPPSPIRSGDPDAGEGRRAGWVIRYHMGNHDVYLLDEFESFDMRQLVRQCGVLDFKYAPDRWVGDYHNDAASLFIDEMNAECRQGHHDKDARQLALFGFQTLDT